MKTASLMQDLVFAEGRPAIKVLMDTDAGKEIRIRFKKGQIMKEHSAPLPIVVEVFDGEIDFGVNGVVHNMKRGDLIALDPKVPHDLTALDDSIVRLSLSKGDSVSRVKKVTQD